MALSLGCRTAASDRYEACVDPAGEVALEQARQLVASDQHERAVQQLRLSLAACPDRVRTHLLYVEEVQRLAGTAAGETAVAEMHDYYRVADDQRSPVWPYMRACLAEHAKAIAEALSHLHLDYLYNGILQHSDEVFSSRFVKDYTSGELNYILWKHVHILSFIQELLAPYHKLFLNFLAFPKLGPL